jgi:hypothetical protein
MYISGLNVEHYSPLYWVEVHGQFHDLTAALLQRTPSTHLIVDHVGPRADLGIIMERDL